MLNSVDILGELGCIGSYRMHELGFMRYAPESEFIYGECKCPLLEDPDLKSVKNDREKLVDNEVTRALLEFIRREVESLAETMSEQLKRDKKTRDLQASSLFNQLLDKWKNKFMAQLTGEIFGGAGIGARWADRAAVALGLGAAMADRATVSGAAKEGKAVAVPGTNLKPAPVSARAPVGARSRPAGRRGLLVLSSATQGIRRCTSATSTSSRGFTGLTPRGPWQTRSWTSTVLTTRAGASTCSRGMWT